MSRAAIFALALVLAAPAEAQAPRTPDQRQVLLDLAFVLGEAHALRTACRGAEDQTWRARMTAMIQVEQPEEAFRRTLVERFNAGFMARLAAAGTCGSGTAEEERAVAGRGKALADRLSGAP